jgi:hypothetical protein
LWRRERRERLLDEERRNSRAVNAWVEERSGDVYVVVVNSGPDPITDWSVSICSTSTGTEVWHPLITNRNRGTLDPHRKIDEPIKGIDPTLVPSNIDTAIVQVTFLDSDLRKWWNEAGTTRRVD